MQSDKVVFASRGAAEFVAEAKQRVAAYFAERGVSDKANAAMVVKTVLLLLLTFGSYGLILSGLVGPWAMLALAIAMGVGVAGIGFCVSHDALHGSYSRRPWVNRLLGYTFDVLGANSYMWKLTHNGIHHTWTNVPGVDEDLVVTPVLRLSPHEPHRWFHRFQTLFALPAYATATLFWAFAKDYKYFFAGKVGPYRGKRHPTRQWVGLFAWKAVTYAWTIVIPLLVLPVAWWQFLIGYLAMHLTAGLILGVVFMLAHVVEDVEYPAPDAAGHMQDTWFVHQLRTTADFARKNRLLTWYVGALNYQVEHHLFPKVCSVHYPQISPIVEQVASEHGMPYHASPTMWAAIRSHFRMLRRLGRRPTAAGEAA
jgi:linoleoyl-CoA desaturase